METSISKHRCKYCGKIISAHKIFCDTNCSSNYNFVIKGEIPYSIKSILTKEEIELLREFKLLRVDYE